MEFAWTLHRSKGKDQCSEDCTAYGSDEQYSTARGHFTRKVQRYCTTKQFTFLFRRISLVTQKKMDAGKTGNRKRSKKLILGGMGTSDELGEINPAQDFVLPFVRFDDIVAATHNFSDACKIGQGGFGKVYMVTLSFGSSFL
jgi:hypothetical protein